jgi:predicted DNA helicase
LVAAPSNTAADLLTERLANAGLQVVRIGNISRVDEHILPHTLDSILARHPESKNIKKVKLQAAEYRRQSRQHKRSFGHEERREREHLKTQARELEAWANTLEERLLEEVLSAAQAITCTLVGAAHPVLERSKFRTCIIDEAAQALEPAAWIPILKCSRVVLAGDPFQLPPTVKSLEAARQGLSKTLIERCLDTLPQHVHLLDVQYRMHRAIMDFSNQYFYQGALKAHETVGDRRLLTLENDTLTVFEPVVFIDTAGTGFEEKINRSAGKNSSRFPSKYNPDEALLVREHLLKLMEKFPDTAHRPNIGVLSPYREQVNFLEEMVRNDVDLAPVFTSKVAEGQLATGIINTIDGFQGQERDVIYISLVRSNAKNEIGFLSDYRRMNVAMTRARKLLVVIGDSATIGNNPFYSRFLEYCEKNGAYQTAWEYMK